MTHNGNSEFDDAIRAVRADEPSPEQLRAAAGRLLQRMGDASVASPETIRGCDDVRRLLPAYKAAQLPVNRAMLVEAHLSECLECRKHAEGRSAEKLNWAPVSFVRPKRRWTFAMAAAAAVVLISAFFINNAYFAIPAGARGTLETLDGAAYKVTPAGDVPVAIGTQFGDGEVLRTAAGSHAFVKLTDGSLVEVRERSEFAVKARGKNETIALDRGAVIVQAAKREAGHLYVKTPDCRVAVTGTVFSVNSGMKGSRVSVVEGIVRVMHAGSEDVLRAGDQVSTGSNMEAIPVQQDIAWSRDLTKHLELLAQFSKLQHRLEQVQMPAPRFNSALLGRMPADTVFFASLPNAGQALEEANRILQEQIQQSTELRNWWSHGDPKDAAKMNEFITKLRALSDYLGDEIIVVGFGGKDSEVAVVAGLRRSDIGNFLQTQFATNELKVNVVDQKSLKGLPDKPQGLTALVRQNEVVFGSSSKVIERVNAQLNSGNDGLGSTDFGQRLAESYRRGAGVLIGADLNRLMAEESHRHRHDNDMGRTGLADVRYLILEHREVNSVPDNRMVLDFSGERKGIASWLAAPAPMGSLEFVSPNAAVAVGFIAKDPTAMLDDVFMMAEGDRHKAQTEIAEAESKLNVRIREDLVAHFGGDGAFALDGPVLPTPAWKLILEVHDAPGLVQSLNKIVDAVNQEAAHKGKPGVAMQTEQVNGQAFYTVQGRESKAKQSAVRNRLNLVRTAVDTDHTWPRICRQFLDQFGLFSAELRQQRIQNGSQVLVGDR